MQPFTYDALPARIIFGSGTLAALSNEIERLRCSRAVLLSTPQQADAARVVEEQIGTLFAGHFSGATMHTPVTVTEQALHFVKERRVDCIVSFGGGSTVGLGKALARRTDLPQIAIPTTYAGSEVTPILGQTEDGRKTTVRDLRVLPETVLYDVDLTLTLPYSMSVTSGINAIAHAAEALYARDGNPIISRLSEDGIRALARALQKLKENAADPDARSDALYGAWACGTCLGSAGMALHHKLCHTLGGLFDLPHAETHTVLLPHTLAYNAPATPDAMLRIASALGVEDTPSGLFDLIEGLGGPTSLRDFGMSIDDIPRAVEAALVSPYWNPRALEIGSLTELLVRATRGERPAPQARSY